MESTNGTRGDGLAPLAVWPDPPGLGRILAICCAVGVVLSLVIITAGMLAAGQVWQSSLALGVFIAAWGGLGFGSMIGGVIYLTKLDSAAKARRVEQTEKSRAVAKASSAPSAPSAGTSTGHCSADAA